MRIRDLQKDDLQSLFDMQKDPESRWMAAFGSRDTDDLQAYLRQMAKIADDKDAIYKVVEHEDQVAGMVGKWVNEQRHELMYWTDRRFRGVGLTTSAVKEFLTLFTDRPLYAHTAGDNLTSQAILSNVGFQKFEEVMSFSEIRNKEIVEVGYVLAAH